MLIDNDTLLGVEIELENVRLPVEKTFNWWRTHEDNSLRGGGLELCFSMPLKGADVMSALEEVYDQKVFRTKPKISPRTGIHVHLNVRNLSITKLKNLCVTYALAEEAIFSWVGDYRDKNNFCLPWFFAEGDISGIKNLLYKNNTKLSSGTAYLHRYSALNLNAIHKFGSVEFRHLKTTLDKSRLIDWINIILSLKKFSGRFELAEDIIEFLDKNGEEGFLEAVFGTDLYKKLPYKDIRKGKLIALDLLNKDDFKEKSDDLPAIDFTLGESKFYENFLKANN